MGTNFSIGKIEVGTGNTTGVFEARMPQCQDKECHCYGKVCLVSDLNNKEGNCSAGNVFLNGRAFCGVEVLPKDFGKALCQELGFQDVVEVNVKK